MKTYKVFESGGQKVAVKQGWSWPAFFFAWIWAFTKKLWLPGIIGLVVLVVGELIPVKNAANPFLLITGIVFGIKGNKWWEAQLLKSGFLFLGTVQAKNPAEAVSSKF
jgi:hypothetical protein